MMMHAPSPGSSSICVAPGAVGEPVADTAPAPARSRAAAARLLEGARRAWLAAARSTLDQALGWIVEWHKAVAGGADARAVTLEQIEAFATYCETESQ
jgi:hypothetical protein